MNTAEKFYLRGMASANLSQYATAIEDFDHAIELDPNYVDAYFERGKCLKRGGKLFSAVKNFGKAIELDPNHANAYMERGKCFARLKKFWAAHRDFSRVIEIFPDPLDDDFDRAIASAEAHYRRANVYKQLDDFDAAEADHFQAMSNYVASMMFYMSAEEEMEIIFGNEPPPKPSAEEQSVHDWQSFALSTLEHGKSSYDLGDFDVALKDFDAIIAAVPNVENFFDMEIYESTNEVYIESLQKYFAGAFDNINAAEFNPNRVFLMSAYVGRGQCSLQLGDDLNAQADFAQAKALGFDVEDFGGLRATFDI